MTKLLTLSILFSVLLRAVLVAKLVILGILPLILSTLTLRVVSVAKLVILGILSSVFFILALNTSFLTTLFLTPSLNLLKLTGTGNNLLTSNLSTFFTNFLN